MIPVPNFMNYSYINRSYNRLAGYVLFPFRIVTILLMITSTIGGLLITDGLLDNKDLSNKLLIQLTRGLVWITGLNINFIKDKNYQDFVDSKQYPGKNYLIAFNHVHFYDNFIMYSLLQKMLCAVMIQHFAELYPVSILFKISNSIMCNRNEKMGTVEKIRNKVQEGEHVVIAPDSCQDLKNGALLAPFKTGAFAVKETILPVLIRFVSSSTDKVIWDRYTHMEHVGSLLLDGHIEGYIQLLDFEDYNNEKDIYEFRDRVWNKMNDGLTQLPSAFPPRVIENSPHFIRSHPIMTSGLIHFLPGISVISWLIGYYTLSILSILMLITGYFTNNYPTNNAKLLNQLVCLYTLWEYICMDVTCSFEFIFAKGPLLLNILYIHYNLKCLGDEFYDITYYNEIYKLCAFGLMYMVLNYIIFRL